EEKFQATEQHASQTYESAAKGTVSGQVFVSTKGGENSKLGAVQVALFARDAIDGLLPGLKNYADYKIQGLSGPVAEAKAALDQARASEKTASEAAIQAIKVGGDYMAANNARDVAFQAVLTA